MSIKKMLNKKQHQMFNVEEREKFKFRKSKKYKNLCSVALGVISITGLATGPVYADEVATNPATNLVTVQPESSAENAEEALLANETSGTLTQEVFNPNLNEAVTSAQQAGAVVTETSKEIKATIEEANADLAKQVEAVSSAGQTQKEVDEKLSKAAADAEKSGLAVSEGETVVYKNDNEAALAEASNQASVIAEAIKAQEEVATSLQEATKSAEQAGVEVSKGESLTYKDVNEALQDLAKQVELLNEATVTKGQLTSLFEQAVSAAEQVGVQVSRTPVETYSDLKTALAAMQEQVKAINGAQKSQENINKALESAISEAAKNHTTVEKSGVVSGEVAEVTTKLSEIEAKISKTVEANKAIAEQNRTAQEAYNQAKAANDAENARINAENERIRKENEEKRLRYERELAAHKEAEKKQETTTSASAAEIEQRNAAKRAAYEKALAEYNANKGTNDAELARLEANKSKDGFLSEVVKQGLKFEDESGAEISVEGTRFGVVNLDAYRAGIQTANVQQIFYNIEDVPQRLKAVYGTDMKNISGTYENYVHKLQEQYDFYNNLGLTNSWNDYIRGPKDWNHRSEYNFTPTGNAYSSTPILVSAQGGEDSVKSGVLSILKPNESATATYTNLKNSTYLGEPISKVTVKVTNQGTMTGSALFAKNPAGGVSTNAPSSVSDFNIEMQFFREDGSVIEATKDYPMVIGFSSLSRYDETGWSGDDRYYREGYTREGITNISFRPAFYNGSGIVVANSLEELATQLGMKHKDFNLFSDGKNDKSTLPTPFYYYGASHKNMGIIPDDFDHPDFYKMGFVGIQESGNKISFNMTRDGRWNYGYWMSLTTKVPNKAVAFVPVKPQEPTYETPPTSEKLTPPVQPTYAKETPNVPFTLTPPKQSPYETVTVPELKVTTTAKPIGVSSKTHDINLAVDTRKVQVETTVHRVEVAQQPKAVKLVSNGQVSIDGQSVPKGSTIEWALQNEPLKAGREEITDYRLKEPFPSGIELDTEWNSNNNPDWLVSTDEAGVTWLQLSKKALEGLNQNRDTEPASVPSYLAKAKVLNDSGEYKNTFTTIITTPSGQYQTTSGTVVVTTPPPATPEKANTNAAGVNIDGKVVPIGGTNYYTITLDYDQYRAIEASSAAIQGGFGAFDDYPEEALVPDLSKAIIIDSDGQPVTGLTLKQHATVEASDDNVRTLLDKTEIGSKISGAFISITADDPTAYYNDIVKTKRYVKVTIPMVVKDDLYNTGRSYSNTAYQADFGNGYVTNTVVNTTPRVKPNKTNTDSSGVVIDGKAVVANSVNYYKVTLDYSNYKGIDADPNMIAKGFFLVDDFPEETVVVENNGIKVETNSGEAVKGLTTTIYSSIAEAPKAVQESMAKRGFEPKGAIAVLAADEPQVFYETYVKTGLTLTATLPMTVKAEMAKTGGQYENTAYQIDFGSSYVTETVVNNVIPVGRVIVNYLEDGTGKVLDHPVIDEDDVLEGTDYDTTDRKRTEIITKDGKTYDLVRHEGNETGKVVKGDTVITYFYKEVLGEVVVNYKDTNGKVIKESVTDTPLTSTGTAYDTKDNKPETIVRPDGSSFRLVPAKTVGAEEGKIVRGRTEVTYVYEEILGSVSVDYTDKDGNVIKEPVVDTPTGSTGRDYDTTDNKPKEIVTKDGKTYQIVPELTKGNEKGKVVEGDTKITYVYEEIKADVIVHYVDEAGNVIKKPVKDTEQASTGTDYDTTDNKPEYIDVDGVRYKLMPKKTIGNETGKLTKEGAEVTYVYHKIVTNWVTEEDRKPLKPQEDGEKEKGSFEGRIFVVTEVDPETGDITHVFKKVPAPTPTPQTPKPPVTPAPVTPPAAPVVKSATLPATGEVESSVLTATGLAVIAASAGLTVTKRRKEDN